MPSRDYFLKGRNERQITAYQTFAINVAEALGANPNTARDEMSDMVDFEVQIANVCLTPDLYYFDCWHQYLHLFEI